MYGDFNIQGLQFACTSRAVDTIHTDLYHNYSGLINLFINCTTGRWKWKKVP